MSEYKLAEQIIARSVADTWDTAKLEWALDEVYEADEAGTCLCGHFPIIETCVLVNKKNGGTAEVGNCCVKKFIGLPSDKIFQAIKRVRKDGRRSLNAEAIDYARQRGWINDWERGFYLNIMRKKVLSQKQRNTKIQINEKLAQNVKKRL